MTSNTTTVTAVDLNDWSFRNWPAVVFDVVKNILFFISAAMGVIAILVGVVALIAFAIGAVQGIVLRCQALQQKTGPPAGNQNSVEEHLLHERDIGDEEAAEHLVTSENGAGVLERDEEEAPPTYDAIPQEGTADVMHKA